MVVPYYEVSFLHLTMALLQKIFFIYFMDYDLLSGLYSLSIGNWTSPFFVIIRKYSIIIVVQSTKNL